MDILPDANLDAHAVAVAVHLAQLNPVAESNAHAEHVWLGKSGANTLSVG